MFAAQFVLSSALALALVISAACSFAAAEESNRDRERDPSLAGRIVRDVFDPRQAAIRASRERYGKPLDICWEDGRAGRADRAISASERAIAAVETEHANRRGEFRLDYVAVGGGSAGQVARIDALLAQIQAEALRCAAFALARSPSSDRAYRMTAAQKFDAALEAVDRMQDAEMRFDAAVNATTRDRTPSPSAFPTAPGHLPHSTTLRRESILLRARVQIGRAEVNATLGDWATMRRATDDVIATVDKLREAPVFLQGDNDPTDEEAIALVQRAAPLSAYALSASGDFAGAFERLESGRAYRLFRRIARQRLVSARERGAYEACRVSWGTQPNYDWFCLQNMEAQTRALIRTPLADQMSVALNTVSAIIAPSSACGAGQVLLAYRTPAGVQVKGVSAPEFTCRAFDELLDGDGLDAFGMEARRLGWRRAYEAASRPGATSEDLSRWRDSIPTISDRMSPVFGSAIVEALRQARVQPGDRILILLPGALSPLPLGLMRSTHPARLLIDDYEVVQAPSLFAYTNAMETPLRPRRALIVANPTQSLPAAAAEGAAIVRWFPNSEQLGSDARLTTIKPILPDASIWHFATHARFDWQNPDQSSLALGGGDLLLLSDLASMLMPSAPQLVFLSACETGLSSARSGDEFIGLPAAFLELGAKNVIATLWSVSDVSSALLSMKFYELYAGKGQRSSEALRGAQLWLRAASADDLKAFLDSDAALGMNEAQVFEFKAMISAAEHAAAPFRHPYYWAGYVALGP